MSNDPKNGKTEFIRLVLASIEGESQNKEQAKEYLTSQGIKPDMVVSEGLKRIKKMQLQIEANKTRQEMLSSESMKEKALAWVNNILGKMDFSLPDLVRNENLSMSFRNVETLSKEDIKNILVKHFTLKFIDEEKKRSNGL
jgi:hypothetical protein